MSVRCGNPVHKSFHVDLAFDEHHHDTVAQVRLCYARKDEFGLRSHEELALQEQWDEQQLAEITAELAAERYLEDRGWEDAFAQREYEDRMGVVQFEDAYRAAMGA